MIWILAVIAFVGSTATFGSMKVGAANATGTDVANYAKKFIGCSYVYGAAGPNSFDCSGLVKYVYGHFGVSLPHSAQALYDSPSSYGRQVSESNRQVGDIVTWGTHAAIYVGNGKVVNALCQRTGVCYTNISTFRDRYGRTNPSHKYIRVFSAAGTDTTSQKQVEGLKTTKITKNSITLSWTKFTGAKSYVVYKSANDGKTWQKTTADKNSITFNKLSAGHKYRFKVAAQTSNATSKTSNVIKTQTRTISPTVRLNTEKDNQLGISWSDVPGASSYTVFSSADNENWIKNAVTEDTNYTLKGLEAGRIYVKVAAENSYGLVSANSKVHNAEIGGAILEAVD